jgi:hypothetical protein
MVVVARVMKRVERGECSSCERNVTATILPDASDLSRDM